MAAETLPVYPPTRGESAGRPASVHAAEEAYQETVDRTAPRIGVEIERLNKTLQQVSEAAEHLMQRVSPVTAPARAAPDAHGSNGRGDSKEPEPSALARTLTNMRSNMEDLCRRLESTADRVEL